jgi:hypothetical protein
MLLSLCLWLALVTAARCQAIDSLLDSYNSRVPQEKVHIHFDNSAYSSGETIWYKAYLLNGIDPSDLSKNFYIDWFDTNGKLLERTIAPIIGSCASGNFTIPQKFTGNQLQVMAYTRWMLNFDSAFLFHKIIPVAQAGIEQRRQPEIIPVTNLLFFPEGGDMVENIPGAIAFKARNSAGMPMQVSGVINDRNGQPVTTFTSRHDGMGKIRLTPAVGEVYTAEWKDASGNTQYTRLPVAKSTGIILSVINTYGTRTFTVERPAKPDERFRRLSIVAHMHQQVVFRAVANLSEKTKIISSLPVNDFPSGVLQVTVFDSYQRPLAERILFVNNDEYHLDATVHTDTLNLEKRGKNVYEIEVPDSIPTSLSIAVTDGDTGHDPAADIVSRLLLSAEIKGHVHNPAYYFSTEDSASAYLDLVMLTNGWRRFRWEDVWARQIPKLSYQRDSTYLSIAGKIDNLSESKIKKAELINLILLAKDSSKQFVFTPLRPDGSFGEDNLILFDTTKVFYKLNNTSLPGRSNISIKNTFLLFDSTRSVHSLGNFLSDTSGLARINAIADEKRKLETLMRQTTLKEVIVTAKIKSRIEELNDKYARGLFESDDAYQFAVMDDLTSMSAASTFAYLQSKVAGLSINNSNPFNPNATWRGAQVAFFLDEMPVDATALASIPMAHISFIKVFRPPFFGASLGGSGGAIAVYTKKGDDQRTMSMGLDYTLLPGYTPVKQFYSPDYAEKQINFTQPDLRRTLYWKPNIQTDGANRKVRISFYNNDVSHSLQLVLEGIALDGRMIHLSKLLK